MPDWRKCAPLFRAFLFFIIKSKESFERDENMEIIEMSVEQLKPYENNPRKNDDAVDKVAASISEFGFKVPIIVDKDNVIVAGHTRLKAAEKIGLKTVPVIRADDLTEEQVRAFRLADNKTAELAGWDFSALEEELDNIEIDMKQFGFLEQADLSDIDSLFVPVDEPKEKEPHKIQCPHCGEWFEA